MFLHSVPAEDAILARVCETTGHDWVKETSPATVALVQKTLAKPDKDSLPKDSLQPYSIEGGSISLGDQFTECEQEEDITHQPVLGSMSPPDKEFLLPKSLSEELTKEMRDLKQTSTVDTEGRSTHWSADKHVFI